MTVCKNYPSNVYTKKRGLYLRSLTLVANIISALLVLLRSISNKYVSFRSSWDTPTLRWKVSEQPADDTHNIPITLFRGFIPYEYPFWIPKLSVLPIETHHV